MTMESMTFERVYVCSVEQSNAINAAADLGVNQKLMAEFYRDCLIADLLAQKFMPSSSSRVDWKAVNAAILRRWPKGLERIKKLAWKMAEKVSGGI